MVEHRSSYYNALVYTESREGSNPHLGIVEGTVADWRETAWLKFPYDN